MGSWHAALHRALGRYRVSPAKACSSNVWGWIHTLLPMLRCAALHCTAPPARSTCCVNGNQPKGSRIEERTYPLLLHGKPIDHSVLVQELQQLPADEAELKARLGGDMRQRDSSPHLLP